MDIVKTLTAQAKTLTAQVKTLTAQVKTLTAQVKTLTAQVKTLTDQGSYLLGVHVQSIGPIYASLLLKGVAAHIFWHSENLYPVEVQLSVSQLTYLNHELERLHTASHDAMSTARQIFARYRSGPPSQPPRNYSGARITTTFPSLPLPLQHSILGNGPREAKNVFNEKGQQLIVTKVRKSLSEHSHQTESVT
jgi:phage host-nuclease inhibitor protein Gam